jgi:hypothetical protein
MLERLVVYPMVAATKFPTVKHLKTLSLWLIACVVAMVLLRVIFAAPKVSASGLDLQVQAPQNRDVQQSEIAVPLPKGKRLILTDGSFQIVREYHREGDRVRYYSLERSAWEEIPTTLVDWAATQKAEEEQDAQQKELAKQIAESEKKARFADLDVDTSFEVRPGTFLPDNVGFYVLDGNKIASMQQEKADLHTEKGRELAKIVTGVPLISSKQDMEILGKQAKLRIHTGDAEFYFRTADKREPRLTLLRAEVKGEKRTVAVISTNIAGRQTFKNREVSLLQWDAARGLYRYTVDQPLESGEYAIIEKTSSQEESMYVWTFGVDLPTNPKTAGGKPVR